MSLVSSTGEKINVIDFGSNEKGSWVKYENGTMEILRKFSTNIACNNPWGSLYYGIDNTEYDFPISFIEPPSVFLELNPGSDVGFIKGNYIAPIITNKSFKNITIIRPTANINPIVNVQMKAIGKWK